MTKDKKKKITVTPSSTPLSSLLPFLAPLCTGLYVLLSFSFLCLSAITPSLPHVCSLSSLSPSVPLIVPSSGCKSFRIILGGEFVDKGGVNGLQVVLVFGRRERSGSALSKGQREKGERKGERERG